MSLCDNQPFQHGNVHTDFIKENRDALFHREEMTATLAVAAASAYISSQQPALSTSSRTSSLPDFDHSRSMFHLLLLSHVTNRSERVSLSLNRVTVTCHVNCREYL
jgi:acetyl/propionyl-CoA carboxylase alpha subunit